MINNVEIKENIEIDYWRTGETPDQFSISF